MNKSKTLVGATAGLQNLRSREKQTIKRDKAYFLLLTVVGWVDVFSRKKHKDAIVNYLTPIKNIHAVVFLLAVVIVFFVSCKKKEKQYYSTHVFWFDKATRDSLVSSGNYYLMASYDYTFKGGESGFMS